MPLLPPHCAQQMPEWADRVANPGYYMLWVLDGDVPCQEAAWIQLTSPKKRRRRAAA
jgi:hypothetical protein